MVEIRLFAFASISSASAKAMLFPDAVAASTAAVASVRNLFASSYLSTIPAFIRVFT